MLHRIPTGHLAGGHGHAIFSRGTALLVVVAIVIAVAVLRYLFSRRG